MLTVVILAAGLGKRMKSNLPKPMHILAGKPILTHVLETAKRLNPQKIIVVYGHKGEIIKQHYANERAITWVEQKTFLGTGDAMKYALPELIKNSKVLVLYGDTPLIDHASLQALIDNTNERQLAWLTVELDNPHNYGRIIRNDKQEMCAILEEKDIQNSQQRSIKEINSGLFAAPEAFLQSAIPLLKNENAQKEFYLTDIVEISVNQNFKIHTISGNPITIRGVNDRLQLAELERAYQLQQAQNLMLQGVTVIDPNRLDIRGEVLVQPDVLIDVGVILEGKVVIEGNVKIGAHCIIRNSTIKSGAEILPFTSIDESEIGENAQIGPYARIRPQSVLEANAKVGNFVEIKKSRIGLGSKVNHLSYIGDATVGKSVNVGAGTITCNYDGVNKFKTVIEDNVFIGSNTALVAPVVIHEYATIGAGSTITQDIDSNALAFNRAPIKIKNAWQRPVKISK